MSSDAVLLESDGPVLKLILNRPDQRNALVGEIVEALSSRLEEIPVDETRCLVLEGNGKAFSAGGDIRKMKRYLDEDRTITEIVAAMERNLNPALERMLNLPVPTVAKIDGAAVGAGASLALTCDLQLASERSAIGFVFRSVGLSIDTGVSYLLPRVVGMNVAKELVFTGEIVEAERAKRLGLFNHVYDTDTFDRDVQTMVDTIASGPTEALRQSKRLLNQGFEKTFEQALSDEAWGQAVPFKSDDHAEGVEAFLEKRSPDFRGT